MKLAGKVYDAIEMGIENITIEFSSFSEGYILKGGDFWSYDEDITAFFGTNFGLRTYSHIQDLPRWWTYEETVEKLNKRIESVKSHIKIVDDLIKVNKRAGL